MSLASDVASQRGVSRRSDGLLRTLAILFFLSGLAAVGAEVVWARILQRVIGSTAVAVATVLAGFLGGMGAGALLVEALRRRLSRPLRAYAVTEFLAALATLLATALLEQGVAWSAFGAAEVGGLLLVIVASLPIGATLPLAIYALSERAEGSEAGLPTRIRKLYGWNAVGGGCGALLAGLVGVTLVGERGTIAAVVLLQLAIAGAAFWRFARLEQEPAPSGGGAPAPVPEVEAASSSRSPVDSVLPALFLFLSGLVVFYWEVYWSRLLALTVGATVYAFAFVSASVIFGIGFGSLLFARGRATRRGLWLLPLVVAGLLGVGYFAVPLLPDAYLLGVRSFGAHPLVWGVAGAAAVPLIPNLLLGVLFPWVVGGNPQWTGRLYAWNSGGSLLGAFLGGPLTASLCTLEDTYRLGVAALFVLAGVGALLGNVARPRRRRGRSLLAVAAVPVLFGGLFLLLREALPGDWDAKRLLSGVYQWAPADLKDARLEERLAARELLHLARGREVIVSVEAERATNTLFVRGNGKVEGSVPLDPGRSSLADLPTQVLLGEIPSLLTSRRPQREVLLIGLGSGVTLGALLQSAAGSRVEVIEIEEAFFEAIRSEPARPYLTPFLPDWFLSGPQQDFSARGCQLHFGDARRLLQSQLRERRWDAIVSQPSEPWIPGSSGLFTEEFFSVAAQCLKDGGLFLQWLQLYKVEDAPLRTLVRTFQRVFPVVYLLRPPGTGELLMLGSGQRLDLTPLLEAPGGRLSSATGLAMPADRLAIFVSGPRGVEEWVGQARQGTTDRDGPIHRDGRSDLVLAITHSLYSERNLARENLRRLQELAGQDPIAAYLPPRHAEDPRLLQLLAARNYHFGDLEEALALLEGDTTEAANELRRRCREELRAAVSTGQNRSP